MRLCFLDKVAQKSAAELKNWVTWDAFCHNYWKCSFEVIEQNLGG